MRDLRNVSQTANATSDSKLGTTDSPPQVQPLKRLMKALKNDDLELFKTVYSRRLRAKFAREGWQEKFSSIQYLPRLASALAGKKQPGSGRLLEQVSLRELDYQYDAKEGRALMFWRKKSEPELSVEVIEETGIWVIDEY